MSLKDSVVLVQSVLTAIADADIEEALLPETLGPGCSVVRLESLQLDLRALSALDWGAAQEQMMKEVDGRLRGVLAARSGAVLYFGMAPIPLAMELGSRIATTRKCRVFQQRHEPSPDLSPLRGTTLACRRVRA